MSNAKSGATRNDEKKAEQVDVEVVVKEKGFFARNKKTLGIIGGGVVIAAASAGVTYLLVTGKRIVATVVE